jgi:hypothetical protein
MTGANPLHPDKLSAYEREAEVGRILGAGLRRMWSHKSTSLSSGTRDSLVEISVQTRGCVGRKPRNRVGRR